MSFNGQRKAGATRYAVIPEYSSSRRFAVESHENRWEKATAPSESRSAKL
jgi:hypothetical protein